MMTRKKLEALVWKHTHRDFKGRWADGTRNVLHNESGVTYGTESWPLSKFTTEQLIAKLPSRVRAEHGLDLAKRDASRQRRAGRAWSVWSYGHDGTPMHVESFRDKGAAKSKIARLRASHPGVRYEIRRPRLADRRVFGTRAHTRAHRDPSRPRRTRTREQYLASLRWNIADAKEALVNAVNMGNYRNVDKYRYQLERLERKLYDAEHGPGSAKRLRRHETWGEQAGRLERQRERARTGRRGLP